MRIVNSLVLDTKEHISRFDAGLVSRAIAQHAGDDRPARVLELERIGEGGCYFLDFHADPPASHAAGLDYRIHHLFGGGYRNRETDAHRTARARINRGIDADQVPARVDQCAAGIARVDGGIRLDEILKRVDAKLIAAQGAHYAGGHGLADTERIADRQHDVADLQCLRRSEGNRRKLIAFDAQDGQIAFGVAADLLGEQLSAIGEEYLDFVGRFDNVAVGKYVTRRAHDHT